MESKSHIVRFRYDVERGGYRCSEPGDQSGEFVRVEATDSLPITEEWLVESGGHQVPAGYEFYGDGISIRVIALHAHYDSIEIQQDEMNILAVYRKDKRVTRGQLLALASVLGITLARKDA